MYKFLDILKGNFVTFLRQFLEKLMKNYPKYRKLFWENFEIIWRNYTIILGTFWKFLGKYVRQVSFVKQILNYLLKTLIFRIKKNIHQYVSTFLLKISVQNFSIWTNYDKYFEEIFTNFEKIIWKKRKNCTNFWWNFWVNWVRILRKFKKTLRYLFIWKEKKCCQT